MSFKRERICGQTHTHTHTHIYIYIYIYITWSDYVKRKLNLK